MKLRHALTIFAAFISALVWPTAYGDASPADPHKWNFVITPYFWLVGQNGEVTIKGDTTDLDTDLIDNMKAFDIGGQFYAEARNGKWGFFTDMTYSKSSTDSGNVDVTVEYVQADFGALYRFVDRPLETHGMATDEGRSLTVDAIVGGRYLSLHNETEISIQPGFTLEIDEREDWVTPIVGALVMADLSDRLLLILRGDIGGLGTGSNRMWNAAAFLGYEVWPNRTFLMGYRILDVDFAEGEGPNRFEYDVVSHGPLFGFAFQF